MRKRVVAVAAALAAALTVDHPAPAPGQAITVTMSGCRPDTFALFGVDQILLGSGRAGSDGVARATITIPATLPAGPHTVSGFCLGANGLPLFLRTTIEVTPAGSPPSSTPPPSGGTSTGTDTGSGAGGRGSRAGGGRGGGTTPAASVPSADEQAAPTLP